MRFLARLDTVDIKVNGIAILKVFRSLDIELIFTVRVIAAIITDISSTYGIALHIGSIIGSGNNVSVPSFH